MQFADAQNGLGLLQLSEIQTGTNFPAKLSGGAKPLLWKLELTSDISDEKAFFTVDNTTPAAKKEIKKPTMV
jgi:hypothetical protein